MNVEQNNEPHKKEAFPEDSTRIQLKHEETYLKRKERIDQQIKELSAK